MASLLRTRLQMNDFDSKSTSSDLESLARRLRDERPQANRLELDRMKRTAMARAARRDGVATGGKTMKSKFASVAIALGLVFGGAGGVMAASGGIPGSGGSSASAPNNQYCPPASNNPGAPKKSKVSCGTQKP